MAYFILIITFVREQIGFQNNQTYFFPESTVTDFGESEVVINCNMLETTSIQTIGVLGPFYTWE